MNRTIGIIAPLIDRHQVHPDFMLRLRINNRELTLADGSTDEFTRWHDRRIPQA